jgi:calcineurin-like phosphoesterase family protein
MVSVLKHPNIFFTSDYHLGHWNILTLGRKRPFDTIDEMHEAIIERHNSVVKPGDIVYNLGDYGLKLKMEALYGLRQRFVGNQFFIEGNHDGVTKQMIKKHPDVFVWAKGIEVIHPKSFEGVPPITICHYAMRVWSGSHKGHWQLYGHSHGMLPELPNLLAFDVGVDCWNFYPVSIEEVKQKMAEKLPAFEAYRASLREQDLDRVE